MLNKNLVGKEVVANIGKEKGWVCYSENHEGTLDYYRDVWVGGVLAYSDGEVCIVKYVNTISEEVELTNDMNGNQVFTISMEQFKEDFTLSV